jgi:hypothetical protein
MGENSLRNNLALALVFAIGFTLLVNLIILGWKVSEKIKKMRIKSIKVRKNVYKHNEIIRKSSE